MTPKRILHVTSALNCGGIENLIMNVFRNIEKDKLVFDFLTIREDYGEFETEITELGGKIFKIPSLKKTGYAKFKKNLNAFFAKNSNYTIVHSHVNTWSGMILEIAKKYGIETRISHAHTAYPKYDFFSNILRSYWKKKIPYVATDFFACSESAAKWLFQSNYEKAIIVRNGVDINKFSFSLQKRELARKNLNIENKLVLITIGRFSKEKDHISFLPKLADVVKKVPQVMWLCVGEGKYKKKFKAKAKKMSLSKNIIILDHTLETSDYLCAGDIYIGTSSFEGFGISALEAQCNGLPCVLTSAFPKEVKITNFCKIMPHDASISLWRDEILSSHRSAANIQHIENFDIKQTTIFLSNFYLNH